MAAIWAGRTNPRCKINVFDGAAKLGAKILVSGGGRCNITHHRIEASAFAGSTPHAIGKVLRRFDVPQTIAFFRELGVHLKQEETGKLFPLTDSARTVLAALLRAAQEAGVKIMNPWRVDNVIKEEDGFRLTGPAGEGHAQSVILATGGKSLPKTGSDGRGLEIAQALGHTLTPRILPALVPLLLPRDHFVCALSGLTLTATLELRSSSGKKLKAFTNSTLCTHFGLSGPAVLDMSRYYLEAKYGDPAATLAVNWWPGKSAEQVEQELQALAQTSLQRYLRTALPERLARALCRHAQLEPALVCNQLTRAQRKTLALVLTQLPLPISGDRGYNFAEVTAGGVPLRELHLETMQSRLCPGLYVCGEMCDVDGRIGGFNFQWAWASGYVAGVAAAR